MNLIIESPKTYSEELPKVSTSTPVDEGTINPYLKRLINNDAFLFELAELIIGLSVTEFKSDEYGDGTLVSNARFLREFYDEITSAAGALLVGMEIPDGLDASDENVGSIINAIRSELQSAISAAGGDLAAFKTLLRSATGASNIGVADISGLTGSTVQDFLAALNDKINTLKPDWADIINKPSTFPPSSHEHDWTEIVNKPSTFPPSSHKHGKSDIGIATGTGTFPGNGLTKTVQHGLGAVPSFVEVVPSSNPQGRLGEVWVGDLTSNTFTVGNTGSFTGTFRFLAVG